MFFISREKKVALMFIGCMTLTLFYVNIPVLNTANLIFVGCFWLSEFNNVRSLFRKLKKSPLYRIYILLICSLVLSLVFSPHLHAFKDARLFLQSELFLKYFAIAYGFWSIKNERCMRTLIKFSLIPLFILTFCGIINLIEHRSFFVSEMMSNWSSLNDTNELSGDAFTDAKRFRVQSMFFNPFDYGYICIVCLFAYIYAFRKKMIKRSLFYVLTFCCWFGILMCGCRTVLLCTIVGYCIFGWLTYDYSKIMKVALAIVAIGWVSYITIPFVNEKVNQMTTLFDTDGKGLEGSTIDMRIIQLATVLYYIEDNPAFGMGVKFFSIDMNWQEGTSGHQDSRLQGLEGVYLSYLLERGIVGYIFYLVIWVIILMYMYRRRYVDKELSVFGISLWVVYFLFAHLTGELLSAYPTLLILGCVFGMLNTKELLYKGQEYSSQQQSLHKYKQIGSTLL